MIRVAEGLKGEIEHLVGAVRDDHLVRRDVAVRRERLPQRQAVRVGVQVQRAGVRSGVRERLRRGREGRLVRVELDVLLILRLLAGGVGRQTGVF